MKFAVAILSLTLTLAAPFAGAEEDVVPLPRDTTDAAVIRGSIAYRTYCVLCHGTTGKGDGRAAKMYTPRPANLTISPFPDKYKEMIIRGGGPAVGRSSFMPPWGDELTDEQITDLISFLRELRKTGTPAS
ncbi:MAG TPA: cytochrome c [Steroidobacteraceae bacterium]|nr:cytochrome c [Steroidobacteraceae bacterium]